MFLADKTKGMALYQETRLMLQNIKSGFCIHGASKIGSSYFDEEIQYAIIIGRFYYAFLLRVKEIKNTETKILHEDIINDSGEYSVSSAMDTLFKMRIHADYRIGAQSLKKRWEAFERYRLQKLVDYYINNSYKKTKGK